MCQVIRLSATRCAVSRRFAQLALRFGRSYTRSYFRSFATARLKSAKLAVCRDVQVHSRTSDRFPSWVRVSRISAFTRLTIIERPISATDPRIVGNHFAQRCSRVDLSGKADEFKSKSLVFFERSQKTTIHSSRTIKFPDDRRVKSSSPRVCVPAGPMYSLISLNCFSGECPPYAVLTRA